MLIPNLQPGLSVALFLFIKRKKRERRTDKAAQILMF